MRVGNRNANMTCRWTYHHTRQLRRRLDAQPSPLTPSTADRFFYGCAHRRDRYAAGVRACCIPIVDCQSLVRYDQYMAI